MKKKIFFVTATNTDVGKTHSSKKLLKKYAKKGYKVGYIKPIETGVQTLPADGNSVLNLVKKLNKNFTLTLDEVVPYQFSLPAAPFVAKGQTHISLSKIKKHIDKALSQCDVLIIEGAGGLMVPIEKEFFIVDLIVYLQNIYKLKTILITPSQLGCINDTLLSINLLKQRKLKYKWFINLHKDKKSFENITLPFYNAYFDRIRFI